MAGRVSPNAFLAVCSEVGTSQDADTWQLPRMKGKGERTREKWFGRPKEVFSPGFAWTTLELE
jgi:hypothetical protein